MLLIFIMMKLKTTTMKNIFLPASTAESIARINQLSADSKPLWGKMNAAQMFAHCCVAYEMVYTDKHKAPNGFMKFMLKAFVKKGVVGDAPYKRNLRTAPQFIIADERDFEAEKARLVDYIKKTQELGAEHFDGKENLSFGKMNSQEWNNLFAKHLDHHLSQFGV